jgi:hypothetical protein
MYVDWREIALIKPISRTRSDVVSFLLSGGGGGEGGRYCRIVVGCTTTCVIDAYQHSSCEFEPRSWRCVSHTILCDKVCQ